MNKAAKQVMAGIGEDKSIFIRTFQLGSEDNFVYPAKISEWTRITGLTESETQTWVENANLIDSEFFQIICSRNPVDVGDQLVNIPFVIVTTA